MPPIYCGYGGNPVGVLGTKNLRVQIENLGTFQWKFIVVSRGCLILGADFPHFYKINIDLFNRKMFLMIHVSFQNHQKTKGFNFNSLKFSLIKNSLNPTQLMELNIIKLLKLRVLPALQNPANWMVLNSILLKTKLMDLYRRE
uniref:Uncharacterized protein n=1 Tax=Lepeophtheirus salmonis TaxID=72036 RepID=A0A0K2TJH8_LEPSM